MVKLNFVHLCDYAFLSQNGKMNIIGDFETIYTSKVPGTDKIYCSFFIVTNFTASEGKYIQRLIIRKNKDKSEIMSNESSRSAKAEQRIGFIGNFGLVFPEYGEYTVEVYINEEKNIELKLNVLEFKKDGIK